jgi:hypothetical protein
MQVTLNGACNSIHFIFKLCKDQLDFSIRMIQDMLYGILNVPTMRRSAFRYQRAATI